MPLLILKLITCLLLKSEYIVEKTIHSCIYGYILSIFWFPLMPQKF